jgi:hypothetical protein
MFKSLVNEICELYRQGLDAPTIASILNMPVKDVGHVINEYAEDYGIDEDYGYYYQWSVDYDACD